MARTSNTQRTLAYLKGEGYRCGIVEKWNAHTFQRVDLFGFIDIIALDPPNKRIIAVQSFGGDQAAHYRKITTEKRDDALLWIGTGNPILLVGWMKRSQRNDDGSFLLNKDGSRKVKKWQPRLYWMTLEDFK